jgi:hypothetical protein
MKDRLLASLKYLVAIKLILISIGLQLTVSRKSGLRAVDLIKYKLIWVLGELKNDKWSRPLSEQFRTISCLYLKENSRQTAVTDLVSVIQ